MDKKSYNILQDRQEAVLASYLLHGVFVGGLVNFFNPNEDEAGIGVWISFLAAAGLVAIGAKRTFRTWPNLPIAFRNWLLLAGSIASLMILQSFLEGTEDLPFLARHSIAWAAFVLVPSIGYPNIPSSVLKAFRWHAILGAVVCGLVIISNWGLVTASTVQRSEGLAIKASKGALYSVYFLLFRLSVESVWVRAATIAGYTQLAIFTVVSGTRQTILTLTVVSILALWTFMRSAVNRTRASQIYKIALSRRISLVISTTVILFGLVVYFIGQMGGGRDLMVGRLSQKVGGSSLWENSRWDEPKELLADFGVLDFMMGRGVLGTFRTHYGMQEDNVHIGWFEILLKGGIPMVLLVLASPVFLAARVLLQSREASLLAAACMCAYFAVKNCTGNGILPTPIFYLLVVCHGQCARWYSTKTQQVALVGQLQR